MFWSAPASGKKSDMGWSCSRATAGSWLPQPGCARAKVRRGVSATACLICHDRGRRSARTCGISFLAGLPQRRVSLCASCARLLVCRVGLGPRDAGKHGGSISASAVPFPVFGHRPGHALFVALADWRSSSAARWVSPSSRVVQPPARAWHDNGTVLSHAVVACPDSIHNHFRYAELLATTGQTAEAVWHFAVVAKGRHAFPYAWSHPAKQEERTLPVEERLRAMHHLLGFTIDEPTWRNRFEEICSASADHARRASSPR